MRLLLLVLLIAGCTAPASPPEGYETATVEKVEIVNSLAIVTIKGESGGSMSMVVSLEQGERILSALSQEKRERPDSLDLFIALMQAKGVELKYVSIDNLKHDTYFATLHFSGLKIDARPSDAIILALRLKKPVYVNKNLLELKLKPKLKPEVKVA